MRVTALWVILLLCLAEFVQTAPMNCGVTTIFSSMTISECPSLPSLTVSTSIPMYSQITIIDSTFLTGNFQTSSSAALQLSFINTQFDLTRLLGSLNFAIYLNAFVGSTLTINNASVYINGNVPPFAYFTFLHLRTSAQNSFFSIMNSNIELFQRDISQPPLPGYVNVMNSMQVTTSLNVSFEIKDTYINVDCSSARTPSTPSGLDSTITFGGGGASLNNATIHNLTMKVKATGLVQGINIYANMLTGTVSLTSSSITMEVNTTNRVISAFRLYNNQQNIAHELLYICDNIVVAKSDSPVIGLNMARYRNGRTIVERNQVNVTADWNSSLMFTIPSIEAMYFGKIAFANTSSVSHNIVYVEAPNGIVDGIFFWWLQAVQHMLITNNTVFTHEPPPFIHDKKWKRSIGIKIHYGEQMGRTEVTHNMIRYVGGHSSQNHLFYAWMQDSNSEFIFVQNDMRGNGVQQYLYNADLSPTGTALVNISSNYFETQCNETMNYALRLGSLKAVGKLFVYDNYAICNAPGNCYAYETNDLEGSQNATDMYFENNTGFVKIVTDSNTPEDKKSFSVFSMGSMSSFSTFYFRRNYGVLNLLVRPGQVSGTVSHGKDGYNAWFWGSMAINRVVITSNFLNTTVNFAGLLIEFDSLNSLQHLYIADNDFFVQQYQYFNWNVTDAWSHSWYALWGVWAYDSANQSVIMINNRLSIYVYEVPTTSFSRMPYGFHISNTGGTNLVNISENNVTMQLSAPGNGSRTYAIFLENVGSTTPVTQAPLQQVFVLNNHINASVHANEKMNFAALAVFKTVVPVSPQLFRTTPAVIHVEGNDLHLNFTGGAVGDFLKRDSYNVSALDLDVDCALCFKYCSSDQGLLGGVDGVSSQSYISVYDNTVSWESDFYGAAAGLAFLYNGTTAPPNTQFTEIAMVAARNSFMMFVPRSMAVGVAVSCNLLDNSTMIITPANNSQSHFQSSFERNSFHLTGASVVVFQIHSISEKIPYSKFVNGTLPPIGTTAVNTSLSFLDNTAVVNCSSSVFNCSIEVLWIDLFEKIHRMVWIYDFVILIPVPVPALSSVTNPTLIIDFHRNRIVQQQVSGTRAFLNVSHELQSRPLPSTQQLNFQHYENFSLTLTQVFVRALDSVFDVNDPYSVTGRSASATGSLAGALVQFKDRSCCSPPMVSITLDVAMKNTSFWGSIPSTSPVTHLPMDNGTNSFQLARVETNYSGWVQRPADDPSQQARFDVVFDCCFWLDHWANGYRSFPLTPSQLNNATVTLTELNHTFIPRSGLLFVNATNEGCLVTPTVTFSKKTPTASAATFSQTTSRTQVPTRSQTTSPGATVTCSISNSITQSHNTISLSNSLSGGTVSKSKTGGSMTATKTLVGTFSRSRSQNTVSLTRSNGNISETSTLAVSESISKDTMTETHSRSIRAAVQLCTITKILLYPTEYQQVKANDLAVANISISFLLPPPFFWSSLASQVVSVDLSDTSSSVLSSSSDPDKSSTSLTNEPNGLRRFLSSIVTKESWTIGWGPQKNRPSPDTFKTTLTNQSWKTIDNASVLTLTLFAEPQLQMVRRETLLIRFTPKVFDCQSTGKDSDIFLVSVEVTPNPPLRLAAAQDSTTAAAATSAVAATLSSAAAGDAQALVAISFVACGSNSVKELPDNARFLLAPLELGPWPKPLGYIFGNLVLTSIVGILQLTVAAVVVFFYRVRRKKDPKKVEHPPTDDWREGLALARFPNLYYSVSMLSIQGTALFSLYLLLRSEFHPIAVLGVLHVLLSTAAMYMMVRKRAKPSFDIDAAENPKDYILFYRYMEVVRLFCFNPEDRRRTLRRRIAEFILPVGRWGPKTALRRFGGPVKQLRPLWLNFALAPPGQAILIAFLTSLPFSERPYCIAQYVALILLSLAFCILAIVARPYRVPAMSAFHIASSVCICVVLIQYLVLTVGDSGNTSALLDGVSTSTVLQALVTAVRSLHGLLIRLLELTLWETDGKTHLWVEEIRPHATEEEVLNENLKELLPVTTISGARGKIEDDI